MTRDEVAVGAEELLEATSAWLAVAVVKQRRAATGLAAIRAKRRACILIFRFLIIEEEQFCCREGRGEKMNVKTRVNRNSNSSRTNPG